MRQRLSEHDVDELVSAYLRRQTVRKMTDRSVRQAAKIYGAGEPLKVAAAPFDVDAKTLAREFRRAGVPIRRRRGWPPST